MQDIIDVITVQGEGGDPSFHVSYFQSFMLYIVS